MQIKITADSTCDLPEEIIKKYDIGIIPLYIVKEDVSYKDLIEIRPSDIFEYVDSGAGICHSAAVNVSDYEECFTKYSKAYDAVIHINISHEFSCCYQNAQLASEGLENVYIIDSRNLSSGSGHTVIRAAELALSGIEPLEIVRELNEFVTRVEASFIIGTLKYLHKGGRCSGLAAFGANLLNLKPCIEVKDGKMDVGKKYRGSFEKVLLQYVRDKLTGRADIDSHRIFVTYPPSVSQETVDSVADLISREFEFDEILTSHAGCVISNHCGPSCLGILFVRK